MSVVTQNRGGELATVTTPREWVALPDALVAAGWELDTNNYGDYIARHSLYGSTQPLSQHGPNISMRLLAHIDRLVLSRPNVTAVSMAQSKFAERLGKVNTAVSDLEREEARLKNVVSDLDSQRCVGTAYYRTLKSDTVVMYANHSAGVTCPVCGSHPDGGRLRKYVGDEQTTVGREALDAMEAQKDWEIARAELEEVQKKLFRVERLIWQLEDTTGTNGRKW